MSFKRLPRFIDNVPHGPLPSPENLVTIQFPDQVDLHPGDTVMWDGEDYETTESAIVYSVDHTPTGTVVVLGKDPACAPARHSGRKAPLFMEDGKTPWAPSSDEGRESMTIGESDVGSAEDLGLTGEGTDV